MFMPIVRIKRSRILLLIMVSLAAFHRTIPHTVLPEDELISQAVSARETLPEKLAIEVEPAALPAAVINDERARELDKIVQAITTVTEFAGGQQERNRGSGFVVGDRFFTVNHNLTTAFPSLKVKSTSFIDGMSVTDPVFSNEEQDVAVFNLPEKLCVKHCNNTEVSYAPNLAPDTKVYWLRKFEDEFDLKEARIIKQVAFGHLNETTSMSCGGNSVVLVDQPFIPGSSGSPVMDAATGKIIGVIQGSVGEGAETKGYFKPINCVIAMLDEQRNNRAIAKL